MGSDSPYRIDLFDDEVESIRVFDPETQRSGDRVAGAAPAAGARVPADRRRHPEFQAPLPQSLSRRSDAHVDLSRHRRRRAAAGHRVLPAAVLRRAPRRCSTTCRRTRSSPPRRDVEALATQAFAEIAEPLRAAQPRCRAADPRARRSVHAGRRSSCSASTALRRIELSRVELDPLTQTLPLSELRDARAAAACASIRAAKNRRASSRASSSDFQGRVLIAAESAGRREMLLDILQRRNVRAAARRQLVGVRRRQRTARHHRLADLAPAWCSTEPPLALIAEEQLFGERARQERRRRRAERDPEKIIRDLTDLHAGLAGRARRLRRRSLRRPATLDVGGLTSEFLVLEYADGDKLYVPVQALDLRQPLHRRAGGDRAAAQARQRCLGEGEAARPRSAFATPPPSCWICIRDAPRARASSWSRTKPSCARSKRRSSSRKRRTRRRPSSR